MSLFFLFVSTHVRYQFDCFPLSFVHNLGINLRGAYAGMPQKFGNGVEVCPNVSIMVACVWRAEWKVMCLSIPAFPAQR